MLRASSSVSQRVRSKVDYPAVAFVASSWRYLSWRCASQSHGAVPVPDAYRGQPLAAGGLPAEAHAEAVWCF